jgi:serine/threonine protein kinase/WD40 repeat protein
MSELSIIESIFHAARAKPSGEERERYLREACGDNQDLRRQVDELLQAQDHAGPFLEQPAAETIPYVPAEGPGTRIGPYKLLQQIGEGGMGVVYMAEQEQPVRRRVALKVIKPGMDSAQVIARFQAERQALAMMDHQNIARVFDAGTTDAGRPYFVMELVHGVPITKYCDDAKLTPRERLDLFVPVCRAIQHAHQKGILHRDIKPSNVLVCLYDGKPVAKVIDFGVAKAMEQSLTERTMFTQFGQVIGTLEYMSPEQAEMSQLGVDTRSDVYSLGVVLYELLTGSTPLQRRRLRDAAFAEILRVIREVEPPPPSTRLSSSKELLPMIALQRHTDPAQLTRLVRGELDWIVMKSIEKDRTRRYESAGSLASDLERFLKDEPVEACPPSATYRVRKYARRHRVLLATAAAFMLLLVAGTAISAWQAVRAKVAEGEALQLEGLAREAEKTAKEAVKVAEDAQKETQFSLNEARQARGDLEQAREKLRRQLYATDMSLVRAAWEDGNPRRVQEVLDRHKPKGDETDLRGFEWYYWKRRINSETTSVRLEGVPSGYFRGYADGVTHAAFSSDGRLCAFTKRASPGAELKVFDATTGKLVCNYGRILADRVRNLRFSRDASFVFVEVDVGKGKSDTSKAYAIGVPKGEILFEFDPTESALHPDDKRLIAVSKRGNQTDLSWRDAITGAELKKVTVPFAGRSWLNFQFNRPKLLIENEFQAFRRHEVRVFDAETGEAGLTLPVRWGEKTLDVRWSDDGRKIALRGTLLELGVFGPIAPFQEGGARSFQVFDASTGKRLWERMLQPNETLRFTPDGRSALLTTAREDEFDSGDWKKLTTFAADNGKEMGAIALESDLSKGNLTLSPDYRLLLSAETVGSEGSQFWVGDAKTGKSFFTGRIPAFHLWHCNFNEAGDELVVLDDNGVVRAWDARPWLRESGRRVAKSLFFERDAVLSPDGRSVVQEKFFPLSAVVPGVDAFYHQLTEVATARRLTLRPALGGRAARTTFLADGQRVAAQCRHKDVFELAILGVDAEVKSVRWTQNLRSGKESSSVGGLLLSGDRKRLAFVHQTTKSTSVTHVIRRFDAELLKELPSRSLTTDGGLRFAALDHRGERLAAMTIKGKNDGSNGFQIMTADTGEITLKRTDLGFSFMNIEFSPDGRRLVLSGFGDFQVRDATSGDVVLQVNMARSAQVRFSPDGRRLVNDGTTSFGNPGKGRSYTFWDADDGREVGTITTEYTPYPAHFTPDGKKLVALRENWEQHLPGDAVLVLDATPFPEDLARPAPEKK